MVRIKDIAKEAGVSPTTVSNVSRDDRGYGRAVESGICQGHCRQLGGDLCCVSCGPARRAGNHGGRWRKTVCDSIYSSHNYRHINRKFSSERDKYSPDSGEPEHEPEKLCRGF